MAKCPHCKKSVSLTSTKREGDRGVRKEVVGTIKKEVMYSCPHCFCILGFAYFIGGLATGRP